MIKYRNILVVLDPTKDSQPALERAAYIASREDRARIKVFAAIYDLSYEMTSMLSADEREAMRSAVIDEHEQWLDSLIAPYQAKGLGNFERKVVWHNRIFESTISEVLAGGHDLVVKSTHEHPLLRSLIFTPTDWHLLRKCPSPVLLVKEHDWPEGGNIIACINSAAEDDEHRALNERILHEAVDVAQMVNGKVHIVNASPAAPVNISIELPEFDPQLYNETIRKHHQQLVDQYAERFQIPLSQAHVKEGLPEHVIPDMAKLLDAELVIMGTMGRTGISAAFMGNSAEQVIDNLDADLLALKPNDFVTPVTIG